MNNTALFKLSYGVYVVTSWKDGNPVGCIANSAMQITSDPATIALSMNHNNATHDAILKSGKFAISILAEKSDPAIIGTFGFKSSRDVNKFENTDYSVKSRLPVINDACSYIVCDVIKSMDTETHTVFLGKVVDADILKADGTPMTYAYYHKVIKGSSPKNAPTYNPEAEKAEQEAAPAKKTKKFKCDICGYVYEGESLPEDYVCPLCGVGAEHFVEIE